MPAGALASHQNHLRTLLKDSPIPPRPGSQGQTGIRVSDEQPRRVSRGSSVEPGLLSHVARSRNFGPAPVKFPLAQVGVGSEAGGVGLEGEVLASADARSVIRPGAVSAAPASMVQDSDGTERKGQIG